MSLLVFRRLVDDFRRLGEYARLRLSVKSPFLVVLLLRVVVFRFLDLAFAILPSLLSLAFCFAERLFLATGGTS